MEKKDNEIHAGTWAFLRCWSGIVLFVSVGIVCFVQDEILGGMGWMLAALWLFLFNVECVFFKALKDYEDQKKLGKNPIFFSKDIGLNEDDFDFWKEGDLSHVPEADREQIEA